MDELLADFLTESAEHLEAIGSRWGRSGRDPSAAGIVDELFPRLRAIRGTSGLLDLPRLQQVAREAEVLTDRLRGQGRPDSAATDVVLAVGGQREPAGDDSELIAQIRRTAVAAPVGRGSAPPGHRVFLTVFALNEAFALPIAFARSGVRIETLTRAPSAPPHLLGFANLGGAAVAVVCLARRLEPTARASAPGGLAIVIASRGQTFALAVQDFGDVVEGREIDITPTHAGSARATLSSQVLRTGTLSAPILDPERVFDGRRSGAAAPSPCPLETGD
jgi:chemotaxis signal transduction protein